MLKRTVPGFMLKFLLLAFIFAISSGCIYLDMSMLDTAEPLQQWRPAAQAYTGDGIDIDTAVFIPEIEGNSFEENYTHEKASKGTVSGFKGALGLGDDYELGVKSWQGEGRGYKLNIKKRFFYQDSISIAISPAVYQLSKQNDDHKFLYGLELPIMLTYRPAKFLAGTLQAHYNIDNYSREFDDNTGSGNETYGPYRLEHFGRDWRAQNHCFLCKPLW
jgi:hypothetical protein